MTGCCRNNTTTTPTPAPRKVGEDLFQRAGNEADRPIRRFVAEVEVDMVYLDLALARPDEVAHRARRGGAADALPGVGGEGVPRLDQAIVGAVQIRAQY